MVSARVDHNALADLAKQQRQVWESKRPSVGPDFSG